LSRRLGFSKNEDPDKVELDLMALFPKGEWYKINYLLIDHGRAVCQAKKPQCPGCPVKKLCPSARKYPNVD
jgi:endonuclease-3